MPAYQGQFENGTITVTVTQGTGPYTYTAYETDGSGTSTGQIAQDANGDNAQSIQTTQTYVFDNMPPGEYYVTAVDSQGCVVFGTTVIDSWPCTSFGLSASVTKQESDFQAADGTISYTVTEGENWDGSTTTSDYVINLILGGSIVQTSIDLTGSFTNLAPGTYTVSVTETGSGSNCSDSTQLTINAAAEVLNRTFYWFHGGGFVYSSNFIGSLNRWTEAGATYYIETDTTSTVTTDLSVAMQYLLDKYNNETTEFPVGSAAMPIGQTITNNNQQFQVEWGASQYEDTFYIAVPNNSDFPEDLTAEAYLLSGSGTPAVSTEKKQFSYNNGVETQDYWLYKIYNYQQNGITAAFI